ARGAAATAPRGEGPAARAGDPKKNGGLLREGERVRFAFIHAERATFPTTLLCTALGVSRSGFYAWILRPPSKREVEDSKLVPIIRACYPQSRGTYGRPA